MADTEESQKQIAFPNTIDREALKAKLANNEILDQDEINLVLDDEELRNIATTPKQEEAPSANFMPKPPTDTELAHALLNRAAERESQDKVWRSEHSLNPNRPLHQPVIIKKTS